MLVTLTVPDEVAEEYKKGALPGHSLEQTLGAQLIKYKACRPTDRFILVDPGARERLEKLTTQLPFKSAEDIVGAVEQLAGVHVGSIRLNWTPIQYRELKGKADRWGMSPEQYTEAVVRRILEEHLLSTTPRVGEMLEPTVAAGAKR